MSTFPAYPGVAAVAARVLSVLLCGLGLAGCLMAARDASEPNSDVVPIALTVQTAPPGAEARTLNAPSCRTPCQLTVRPMGPFTVDLTRDGYEPKTVEVLLAPMDPRDMSAGIRLDPNPLTVALVEIPPPPPPPKPPQPKKKKKPPKVAADQRPAVTVPSPQPWPR
jgi:hypothetical protein